jgi:hypothetical protein
MASSYTGLSSVARGRGMDYLVWYTNDAGGSVEVPCDSLREALAKLGIFDLIADSKFFPKISTCQIQANLRYPSKLPRIFGRTPPSNLTCECPQLRP